MDLKLNYSNVTNKEEAYNAVKLAVTPELLAKWQVKVELEYNTDNISAKGKGFTLNVDFKDDHCAIKLDVSFLLKPLKGKILEGVAKQFQRVV